MGLANKEIPVIIFMKYHVNFLTNRTIEMIEPYPQWRIYSARSEHDDHTFAPPPPPLSLSLGTLIFCNLHTEITLP